MHFLKRRKCIFSFSHNVFYPYKKEKNQFLSHIYFVICEMLSVWTRLKFCHLVRFLTLSQTSPGFYVPAVQVFLKTLSEKEKLLVTSNFSFSHSVFYLFRELSVIFIKFQIVVCNLFQFGQG